MNFFSITFFGLVIISFILYNILHLKYRVIFLSLVSCLFIASFSINLLLYVFIYSSINYFLGKQLPKVNNKKRLYRFGIFINLVQLIILNYASFTIDPFLSLFQIDSSFNAISKFIVPIGVSYFTLQSIGYLINIKMGWEKPQNDFFRFLLYIIFFPKFLSGPIERSNHFFLQLDSLKKFDRQGVKDGLQLILVGFLKKEVIANQLSLIVNPAYTDLSVYSGGDLWKVLLIQPIYLYFDFSGYTDIALGVARLFGIKLLPNFERPFFAESVTNFWRRFHMSLSLWFNDYVFKQAVFRFRKLKSNAALIAVFITWVLFGVWHGAGWNFMFLGLLQAIAIYYEFFTKKWRSSLFSNFPSALKRWVGRIATFFFYGISLIFFFSKDLRSAWGFLIDLWKFHSPSQIEYNNYYSFWVAILLAILFLLIELLANDYKEIYNSVKNIWTGTKLLYKIPRWIIYYLIIIFILFFGGEQTEFIYFQF